MKVFGFKIGRSEKRSTLENPATPISSANVLAHLGIVPSATGITVTLENALTVPEIFAAVNFISGTMAALPLNVFQRTDGGRKKVTGSVQAILHDAVNPGLSSFEWRKYIYERYGLEGRGLSYIEWGGNGQLSGLWPMDPSRTKVLRRNGVKQYHYKEGGRTKVYDANEVIDIPFMLAADMLTARSPVLTNADTVGLALAITRYGSKFFANGGIPTHVLSGPFTTPGGMERAEKDVKQMMNQAVAEGRAWMTIPDKHELKPLGVDPEKGQMIETQKMLTEKFARIYNLPPVFLQDLSHGTFSNTEQQGLNLVKHSILQLTKQFEQEVNLKLFGRGSKFYVEMNVDGLLRGDFKTRMEGYAQGVNNAILKPNEARAAENRDDAEGGDQLYLQGAMVPVTEAKGVKKDEP